MEIVLVDLLPKPWILTNQEEQLQKLTILILLLKELAKIICQSTRSFPIQDYQIKTCLNLSNRYMEDQSLQLFMSLMHFNNILEESLIQMIQQFVHRMSLEQIMSFWLSAITSIL
jgi:hypothetical protein